MSVTRRSQPKVRDVSEGAAVPQKRCIPDTKGAHPAVETTV